MCVYSRKMNLLEKYFFWHNWCLVMDKADLEMLLSFHVTGVSCHPALLFALPLAFLPPPPVRGGRWQRQPNSSSLPTSSSHSTWNESPHWVLFQWHAPLIRRIFFLYRSFPFWLQIYLIPLRSSSEKETVLLVLYERGILPWSSYKDSQRKWNQISQPQPNTAKLGMIIV